MTPWIKALFAFVLTLGMLCQTTLASRSERSGPCREGARKCCGVNCHRCPLKSQGPGCCDRDATPIPVPGVPNPSNDDGIMAAPTPAIPSPTIVRLPHTDGGVLPPVPAAGVPLYQRNCAYLI